MTRDIGFKELHKDGFYNTENILFRSAKWLFDVI